jgi:hypothetical protein
MTNAIMSPSANPMSVPAATPRASTFRSLLVISTSERPGNPYASSVKRNGADNQMSENASPLRVPGMPARVRPHTHRPWNPEDYRARDLQWSLVGLRDGAQLRFKTWLMASDAISSQSAAKRRIWGALAGSASARR